MLPNKILQQQKDALATQRELAALYKQKWTGAWVPCEPFQHGWIRDWELRPDIAARADAENFRLILRHIGSQQWSKERDFLVYRCGKSRRNRPEMPPPSLQTIAVRPHSETGEEIGWPKTLPVHLKKWFYYHSVNAPYCNCYRRGQYYRPAHYYFRTPWMFQLRVRPAFISKVPACDGDLETRIARLEQHMTANQYWPVICRMHGHSYHDYREDVCPRLVGNILEKELRQELYEPNPDA